MSKKNKTVPTEKNQSDKGLVAGIIILVIALALLVAFISFLFSWRTDQSILNEFSNRAVYSDNFLGKVGAFLGDLFIRRGFGIGVFIPVFLLFFTGLKLLLKTSFHILNRWFLGILQMIFISVVFGFFSDEASVLAGVAGFEINQFCQDYLGLIGTILLLITCFSLYCVFVFNVTTQSVKQGIETFKEGVKNPKELITSFVAEQEIVEETENPISEENLEKPILVQQKEEEKIQVYTHKKDIPPLEVKEEIISEIVENEQESGLTFEVSTRKEEEASPEVLAQRLVENFGEFDPTLELKNFQFPPLELLKEYKDGGLVRDDQELNENKNTIIQTLRHYKIDIDKITAVIGPTVTLYEIVPAPGVRISKIKSLEDDIALSLAALGIRIIAPIPGKGTVGIEVPNKKASTVSMRSVIGSQRFQSAEMELPVAFGKTITNETYVVDLAKMPHLLMAGATGQGKSVGLNAVLTSLLYKKHPAEVKFVLVDPKKVELTLYNKIERHYLAKLPDSQDAIITDNTKVINTLNSLCIEMDNRYELLKDAMVRNIKEYNAKFKARLLNPENGHKFLPYIVLVVDEFADLIMTAGKEVELPIARLAQLARAIGIHLIIATQRPSVNVITGVIKANFPARVAFRVSSKIDSRTILDDSGADRLIGRGDMLYTQGNDMVRIQCAFVDTPEVEKIVDFIGSQKAYPDAHLLPEYVGENAETALEFDISERDPLFRDAAEIIVNSQQGSASTLQRKLKLGYNRAGRLIDQLEAAGIVGPFEGSKARKVLIPDIIALEQFFENERKF